MTGFFIRLVESTCCFDKKVKKSLSVSIFPRLVGYNTAQEERLGIVCCVVNNRMPVSQFLGSSVPLLFGACCYNHRQHILIKPCFILRAYQKYRGTKKPRNWHTVIDSYNRLSSIFLLGSNVALEVFKDCLNMKKKSQCFLLSSIFSSEYHVDSIVKITFMASTLAYGDNVPITPRKKI